MDAPGTDGKTAAGNGTDWTVSNTNVLASGAANGQALVASPASRYINFSVNTAILPFFCFLTAQ